MFELHKLSHFPHLFSAEELDILRQWGQSAQLLTDEPAQAVSEKERLFLAVINGLTEPTLRFHKLWLTYTQAVSAEYSIEEAASLRAKLNSEEQEMRKLLDELHALKISQKTAWAKVEEVQTKLAATQEALIQERKKSIGYEIQLGLASAPENVPKNTDWERSAENWREQH